MGFELNLGGSALKKVGGFLEKIGKKFLVAGIESEFAVLNLQNENLLFSLQWNCYLCP